MKKFTLRTMAMTLALCLIAAVMPMPTAEAAVGASVTLNFANYVDAAKNKPILGTTANPPVYPMTVEDHGCVIVENQTTITSKTSATYLKWNDNTNKHIYIRPTNTGEYITFKTTVPEDGVYKVTVTAGVLIASNGAQANIAVGGKTVGSYDWSDTTSDYAREMSDTVALAAGETLVKVTDTTPDRANTGKYKYMYLQSIVLTKVAEPDWGITAETEDIFMYVGDVSDVSVTAQTEVGGDVDMEGMEFAYTADDSGVLSVGVDGKVTALKAGTGTLTVVAKDANGAIRTSDVEITITERPTVASDVNVNLHVTGYKHGDVPIRPTEDNLNSNGGTVNPTIKANGYEFNWGKTAMNVYTSTALKYYGGVGIDVRPLKDGEYTSFDFYVPVAGKYEIWFTAHSKKDLGGIMSVSVGDQFAGKIDFRSEETVDNPAAEKLSYAVNLTAGVNTITFTCAEDRVSGGYENTYFESFSFKPIADIAEEDVFGDTSAYVTKDEDGKLMLTAFSAIDSTNYSKVGFIINADEANATVETKVYETITVNYSDAEKEAFVITPDMFFVNIAEPENAQIFFSTEEVTAGTTVTVQPYAVSLDGETVIKGQTYEIEL